MAEPGDRVTDALKQATEAAKDGRWDAVRLACETLLSERPDHGVARRRIAQACGRLGRWSEAADHLWIASRAAPEALDVRQDLVRALMRAGRSDEARPLLRRMADDRPTDARTWLALGQACANAFDWPPALQAARTGLALAPDDPGLSLLLTRLLMHQNALDEALGRIGAVLERTPDDVRALQVKGDILVRLSRVDEAEQAYRAALAVNPGDAMTEYRLGSLLHLRGDFAGAFEALERRRDLSPFQRANRTYPHADWTGETDIDGRLLVWAETGLGVGETILHSSALPRLLQEGLSLTVEIDPRLIPLYARSFPQARFAPADAIPPADAPRDPDLSRQVPIGSLGRWFPPARVGPDVRRPFLKPDATRVRALRTRHLGAEPGSPPLLVGVSWTSSNPFVGDLKSIPLDPLLRALDLPGVKRVNLQYGNPSEAIAAAEAGTGVRLVVDPDVDVSDDLDGFGALVAAMDLVVCIGHTTAHMAGAVGTPAFVILPSAPFPHWLAEGDSTPWYPGLTLFRQAPRASGWAEALARISAAVAAFRSRERMDAVD